MRRLWLSLLAALLCLSLTAPALAEVAFLPDFPFDSLETMPLELNLSANVTTYAPFDEDRLPQLTSLLKHLALRISWQPLIDETQSSVAVLVDGDEAININLQQSEQGGMAQFSVLPDVTFAGADPLAELLGVSSEPFTILGLDGSETAWLEDGYALLIACEDVLAPYLTEESKVKTDIKNMGTARRKQNYTIPKSSAEELTALLSDACPEGKLKELISSLVFSGKQTLRVYRTEDGAPLRMEWTGNCGVDEKHLRELNLTWRLRRDNSAYRDELSLRSPALSGSDRNSLDWSCSIVPGKSGATTLSGEFTYSWVADKQKTILSGECKLTAAPDAGGSRVTGKATLTQQLPGEEIVTGYAFEPDLLFSGDANVPAVDGLLTVSTLYGKKVTNTAELGLSLARAGYTSWQMRPETVDLAALHEADLEALRAQVTRAVSSAMIRRLVLLPQEDLAYLFLDLPEESVQAIIDAANQ